MRVIEWSQIRNYRSEDLARIHGIDQICFPEDIAFSRAELLFFLNHRSSTCRVADVSGDIVGFALGRIETTSAHILTLDVVPQARRQKVATALVNDLHKEFQERNVEMVFLEVSTENSGARRFYEGLGYHYLEILPEYYKGHSDAYRMVRCLASPMPATSVTDQGLRP